VSLVRQHRSRYASSNDSFLSATIDEEYLYVVDSDSLKKRISTSTTACISALTWYNGQSDLHFLAVLLTHGHRQFLLDTKVEERIVTRL
jgi:hypothetical protein